MKKSKYQRVRDALMKHPGMNEMVGLDIDLPPITRADAVMIVFMSELAKEELEGVLNE